MDKEYKMGDAVLELQKMVLGVTFITNVQVSEQCGIVASKGNQILGLIRINIIYREKSVPVYKAIVRPNL